MSRGFTLVELLIVIAAIVLLMGLFLGAFNSVAQGSWDRATEARITLLGRKVAEVRALKGRYPQELADLAPAIDQPGWMRDGHFADLYGRPIRYEVSGGTFRVWSVGRDGVSGTEDDIVYAR